MNDSELIATAALVNVESVIMAADNWNKTNQGYYPTWSSGTGFMENTGKLREELYRREKIAAERKA